jgi:FOG: HPt domain
MGYNKAFAKGIGMSQPVDTDNLEMLKEVIGDDLKDILQSYLDVAPATLSNIKQAIANGNADGLRLHAHTLKGSSANIGATELPPLCLVLEDKGKDGITDGLTADLSAVEAENDKVSAFLQQYLDAF